MLIEDICKLSFSEVRKLTVNDIGGRILTRLEIDYFLQAYFVHWIHSGDKNEPHALLTSGLHSGEYYDCTFVLQKSAAAKIITYQIAFRLGGINSADWIVGPSFGATFLVSHLADYFDCFHGITEKEGDLQTWKRHIIPPNAFVQPIEDVVTTGGSSFKTINAIKAGNPQPVEFYQRIAAIINRSGKDSIGGFKIVSLLKPDLPKYKPDECPLCAIGSEPAKMKEYLANKYSKIVCS
ncbi:MAG: hypothetical protein WC621_00065 [Patescibacteria group bacterium]